MKAAQGEDEIGLCEMTGWWQGSVWPEAADWCLCAHLTVKEALQRRGLGKFLLAAGLAEMRKAGFRHAGISTDWDNYRAQLLYTSFGFSFRDRTFAFRKELGRAEAGRAAQGIV
jgi:GNAT superfamily N-acetyltransferase